MIYNQTLDDLLVFDESTLVLAPGPGANHTYLYKRQDPLNFVEDLFDTQIRFPNTSFEITPILQSVWKINDHLSIEEITDEYGAVVFPPKRSIQFSFWDEIDFEEGMFEVKLSSHIKQSLNLREHITVGRPLATYHISQSLNLKEKISKFKDIQYVYDTLQMFDIAFDQSNTHQLDFLKFAEKITVHRTASHITHFSDSLVLTDEFSFIFVHKGIPSNNPSSPGVCSTAIPTELVCSFTSGPDTITLVAPNKGNTDALNIGRLNKRTRGGDLLLFRANNWPRQNLLVMDIPMYSCEDVHAARIFFDKYLGQVMQYTDHENNTSNGIVSNTFEIVEQNDVAFMFHVEFTQLF